MKFFKRISIALIGTSLLVQPIYAKTVNLEQVYDSKIRAIQQLPNTYVVANYICDFNGDGIKDLLVSTWQPDFSPSGKGYYIHNTIYTYKNNQMIKLNDEFNVSMGERHAGGTLAVVGSKDGKQNVLKYIDNGNQSGEGYENVYYYKLDNNNKLVEYMRKEHEDDEAGRNIVGVKNTYYMAGKIITQNQYQALSNVFVISRGLYGTYGVDGPTIWAYADQYNSMAEKEFKEDERFSESVRLYFVDRNKVSLSQLPL